uniref:Putative secreted peptide n=1 Tax=Anopheles braziliensis TaxID=58242 RepID=A0A2M3ZTB8_9DIPT
MTQFDAFFFSILILRFCSSRWLSRFLLSLPLFSDTSGFFLWTPGHTIHLPPPQHNNTTATIEIAGSSVILCY